MAITKITLHPVTDVSSYVADHTPGYSPKYSHGITKALQIADNYRRAAALFTLLTSNPEIEISAAFNECFPGSNVTPKTYTKKRRSYSNFIITVWEEDEN